MLKQLTNYGLIISIILASWWAIGGSAEVKDYSNPPENIEVLRHKNGKQTKVLPVVVPAIQAECEDLFTQANDTLMLILTPKRIQEIRKAGAIEIIYPSIQKKVVLGKAVYFTSLLIPVYGEFASGMVFYAGSADASAENANYASLREYGAGNFVRNSRGIDKLKSIIQN